MAAGNKLTYKIIYKNTGLHTRTIKISDVLPAGTEFVSASDDGKLTENSDSRTVGWELTAEPDKEGFVTVTVKVGEDAKGQALKNKADVTVTDSESGQSRTVTTNETRNYTIADVEKAVSNHDGADINDKIVSDGAVLTYDIKVTNPADDERSFTVTDTLPAETKETNEVAVTVLKSSRPVTKTQSAATGPKTGDHMNVILWIVLAILALAGGGTALYRSRRNRKKTHEL